MPFKSLLRCFKWTVNVIYRIHDTRMFSLYSSDSYPFGCRSSVICAARAITIWICRLSSALRWLNSGPRSGPSFIAIFPGWWGGGGGIDGRPGVADFDAIGRDSDNEDADGVRLWADEVDPRSREPAGVVIAEGGGWAAGVGDGGGLAAAGGCCCCWGLLSEKKAVVMADAVDITSARGAGADGRWTGLSPPTIALEMKPEMLENRLMIASLSNGDYTDLCYATMHTHADVLIHNHGVEKVNQTHLDQLCLMT